MPVPAFHHITPAQYASLPPVARRFVRYVTVDTQSDPDSATVPSTEKQKDLGRVLVDELQALGVRDAVMDRHGYVFGTLAASGVASSQSPTVALLAHVDTSPDEPGNNVQPVIHPAYAGGAISFPGDPTLTLTPEQQPALLRHLGQDLITSDGTTLLGSDDKAGVAILMQLAEDLLRDASLPRPRIRLCFTVDEEIGRGVEALDLKRLGADVAYTLDGSSIDALYAETFNAAEATVKVRGVMVHPGYAKGIMVNAARILAELITLLPANEAPETTSGYEGYLHPHTLAASDASFAEVKLILRDFTDDGMARRKALLTDLVAYLRRKHPRAEISLSIRDQYKNMRSYIEATDPRTVSLAHAAAETLGITLEEKVVRGGTDGARLSELGIPTPNVFNGGYDYHSRFEWNTVQNLERSLAFTKALVAQWAKIEAE